MPGEKHPELRRKLDALLAPPAGYQFDVEKAWQGIAPALPARRRTRRWVWMAAALLLLAAGALWWPVQNEVPVNNRDRSVSVTKTQTETSPTTKAPRLGVTTLPASLPVVRSDRKPTESKQQSTPMHRVQPQPLTVAVPSSQPAFVPPSASTVQTAAVPRPRFKVAHINELVPVPMPTSPERKPALALRWDDRAADDDLLSAETTTQAKSKRSLLSFNRPQK